MGRMAAPLPRVVVVYGAVAAHELLRAEAARFHGVEPGRVVVGHECATCGSDEHGQPRLLATATLRRPAYVSLARAGDLSVVAITDAGPVGVDLEAEGAADFPGFDDVAEHPDGRATVQAERTRTWVRKEALLKAHGYGLAVDPTHVRVDDQGLSAWDSPLPPPGAVRLIDLHVPGHVACVAVLGVVGPADLLVTLRPHTR